MKTKSSMWNLLQIKEVCFEFKMAVANFLHECPHQIKLLYENKPLINLISLFKYFTLMMIQQLML